MKKFSFAHVLVFTMALIPLSRTASAQQIAPRPIAEPSSFLIAGQQQSNVPSEVRQAEDAVEDAVRRFGIGIQGGVGVDPELIMFGVHGTFGPIFTRGLQFRPGVELGAGELTTMLGINLDVLYRLPGTAGGRGWTPYIGAGPNFALSRRSFETEAGGGDGNRFDFSDTDFVGGMNFIAGARHRNGMFLELKATAYGVSNVRLLAGYNF